MGYPDLELAGFGFKGKFLGSGCRFLKLAISIAMPLKKRIQRHPGLNRQGAAEIGFTEGLIGCAKTTAPLA